MYREIKSEFIRFPIYEKREKRKILQTTQKIELEKNMVYIFIYKNIYVRCVEPIIREPRSWISSQQ
jgi:hypothetical protein